MPKITLGGNDYGVMILDVFKTFFVTIFRAFGQILGAAIAAGVIGAVGGVGVALFYGFPIIPWMIGGFVVCAVCAIALMFFIANDL